MLTYELPHSLASSLVLGLEEFNQNRNLLRAKGTVVGFGLAANPANDTHNSSNEMPIVIVEMDDNNGYSITTNNNVIIPFTAQCRAQPVMVYRISEARSKC